MLQNQRCLGSYTEPYKHSYVPAFYKINDRPTGGHLVTSDPCPVCGGTVKIRAEDVHQPGNHWLQCPWCIGSMRIAKPGQGTIDLSVKGNDARDVQNVLIAACREMHNGPVIQGGIMKIDVAVLTALPMELQAFLRHGGPWSKIESNRCPGRIYYQYTTDSGLSVIAACALGMGQINAAMAARDLVDEWNPKALVLIGIAGGLGKEVQLGDIVVSDQIVDYELGKVTPAGGTPRWSVYRSDPALLGKLLNFRDTSWLAHVAVPRPDADAGRIPRILHGVVLSGNKVIADEATAGSLSSVWTRATAIEMEGAGIAAALYQSKNAPSFIMIKAICDRADAKKDDSWQPYAAEAAAAFTASFILNVLTPSDTKLKESEKMPEVPTVGIDSRALRLALSSAFDLKELKLLVSDLEIDWDDIAGSTKSERIIELIWYLKRRNRLADLIELVRKERPGLLESYES